MRTARALLLFAAALALAAPAAAHAQRDTIRLGGSGQPRDTINLAQPSEPAAADTATHPEVPARWSRPFAVEGSGEVAPRPPARDPVWLSADTVRARRIAARRASASADELASADSAAATDASDSTESSDSAPPPPVRRPGSRTAARDSASTRRRASSSSGDEGDTPAPARTTRRTTASRDSAATSTRRTASRDTTSARRTSASRDTATTRRTSTARPRTHTVAARETLFGIARRYGVTSAQIRAVNPDLGETLEIGTVLRLPAGARAPASRADAAADERDRPAATRPTSTDRDSDADRPATRRPSTDRAEAPRPAARSRRHTVAAGETLYGLARKFGVTVDAIRRANRLESDTLRPGQALVIPAAPPQR
jgi:membrane-bound lytic murein transglycosylase D